MKTKSIILLFFFLAITASLFAQSKIVKTSFTVYGNCVMCKKRIETALDHKGIKQAVWDIQTKQLEVVYNSSKISVLQIRQWVADAGHDTDSLKAKDNAYASLPFCCLYRDSDQIGNTTHPKQ